MNENISQSRSSSSVSSSSDAHSHSVQSIEHRVWNGSWRIAAVAVGYTLTSTIAGLLIARPPSLATAESSLLSGILIGLVLGPVAARLSASRLKHVLVWASTLFLNTLSVAIEGVFFAPTLSPMTSMPVASTVFLLFQSLVVAALIAWLFGHNAASQTAGLQRTRTAFSWTWRFLLSAFSYLLFYLVFGAVNYALVTKPYYSAAVSGLQVPAPGTVLLAELVRAPLIILSIIPLILVWTGKKRPLGILCGLILFVIGGVVPLLLNTALPDVLRLASGVEILFQNFLTGVVTVALLGFEGTRTSRNDGKAI